MKNKEKEDLTNNWNMCIGLLYLQLVDGNVSKWCRGRGLNPGSFIRQHPHFLKACRPSMLHT